MNKLSQLYYYFSCAFLAILVICALFSGYIASDLPYYVEVNGKSYYPLFQAEKQDSFWSPRLKKMNYQAISDVEWHKLKLDKVIWSPCGYSTKHLGNYKLQAPFGLQYTSDQNDNKIEIAHNQRHILGTDAIDRDIFACLVEGARSSIYISLGAIIIISILGLGLGGMAGFWGDNRFKLALSTLIGAILGLIPAYFYAFYIGKWGFLSIDIKEGFVQFVFLFLIKLSIFLGILYLAIFVSRALQIFPFFKKNIRLPIDKLVTFLTDIQQSIPTFLFISLLSLSLPKGIGSFIIMIGFLGIFGLARFSRTELARIAQMPYIEAGESSGYSPLRLIFRHILPNFFPILAPILLLSIADIIILEAGLSFLGIGTELGAVSWGTMLNDARGNFSSWWLTLFPALTLFFTVNSLYVVGNRLKK